MIETIVTAAPIDAGQLITSASAESAGAVAVFIGTARNSSSSHPGTEVLRLEYEAYVPMAEQQIHAIAQEAAESFGLLNVLTHHRIGVLGIGEAAVVVVVSSPHRAAAFDGCRYVIEELKKRVPIWKKEVFNDGSEWVHARP